MNLLALTWPQAWELIAWTMCYFFVLGTIIASIGALLRFLCRRAAPSIHYTITLAVFAALAISPIGIAAWLIQTPPDAAPLTVPQIAPPSGRETTTTIPLPLPSLNVAETSRPKGGAIYEPLVFLHRTVAYLPWLWFLGAPLTFALLATGMIGSDRLRRQCTRLTEGPIHEATQRLRTSLAVSQRIGIAINDRIAQPILIGILRPLILLPPSALTGWSPDELEMVLLHELTHVRRWDNLVNFAQRLVESLLFFHPAVWLISRQVRHDREECCDAVVVAHTAKPQAYAELLVNIAASPPPLAGLALARHPLAGRIRRILNLEDEPMLVSRSTLAVVSIALLAFLAMVLWQPIESSFAEEIAESQTKITAESAEEENSHEPTVQPAIPVFLSLEDQKLTDLAYRMLNIELEQLGVDELARAKAMKFEGGLLITKGLSGHFSDKGLIHHGDLLVGLHVWPTRSLEDVAKILKRDDIAELSPLKFYVIRRQPTNTERHAIMGLPPEMADKLITGRIQVNKKKLVLELLYAEKKQLEAVLAEVKQKGDSMLEQRPHTLSPGDTVKIHAIGVFPDQPLNANFRVETMGTVALGPQYGRVKIVGKTVLEAEEMIKEHLLAKSNQLAGVEIQVTLVEKKLQTPTPSSGNRYPNRELPIK